MLEYCNEHGIGVNSSDLKSIIWHKLKKYVDDRVKPIVVLMAEAEGHKILFSPPHHSDLQPIELVWANVKRNLGRQYTTNTSFKTVL